MSIFLLPRIRAIAVELPDRRCVPVFAFFSASQWAAFRSLTTDQPMFPREALLSLFLGASKLSLATQLVWTIDVLAALSGSHPDKGSGPLEWPPRWLSSLWEGLRGFPSGGDLSPSLTK